MSAHAETVAARCHVVMLSGGLGSWAAAKRVVAEHGADAVTLLFADTKVEEDDLYAFLDAAAANVGAPLVRVADGRTPFQVFHDDRFLGNARLANCSKFLKQRPCRDWLEAHHSPEDTTVHVGIDWTEVHRIPAIRRGWEPYRVSAPLTAPPYLDRADLMEWARYEGLEPPRAYADGMPHANCLAQGCVRGGRAYWLRMLETRPDAYARTEQDEAELREYLGVDVAILTKREHGERVPLTLRALRQESGRQLTTAEASEWGGCGCFTDDGYDAAPGDAGADTSARATVAAG